MFFFLVIYFCFFFSFDFSCFFLFFGFFFIFFGFSGLLSFLGISGFSISTLLGAFVRQLLRAQVAARGEPVPLASITTLNVGDSWQSCKQAGVPLVDFHVASSLQKTVVTTKGGKEKNRGKGQFKPKGLN